MFFIKKYLKKVAEPQHIYTIIKELLKIYQNNHNILETTSLLIMKKLFLKKIFCIYKTRNSLQPTASPLNFINVFVVCREGLTVVSRDFKN